MVKVEDLPRIDTADQALDVLESVFEDYREDTKITKCQYVGEIPNGQLVPVCLVGTALHRLGVPLEVLGLWDGLPDGRITAVGNDRWGTSDGYRVAPERFIAPEALAVFQAAQDEQDNGQTWREAVTTARYRWDTGDLSIPEDNEPLASPYDGPPDYDADDE